MKRNRETTKYKQLQQKSKLLVLGIISMLLLINTSSAQTLEVGAFGGAAYYLGDLNPQKHFTESNIAYGGVLKYNLNRRIAIGLSATQANIKSNAATYNAENPVTKNDLSAQIYDLALIGEINFFPYAIGDRKNRWTPYIFGGGAVFMSDHVSLGFSAPFGLGFKASPFKRIGLNLFWSARKTFTDDLDDVASVDYEGYNSDWYVFYGLNITFATE